MITFSWLYNLNKISMLLFLCHCEYIYFHTAMIMSGLLWGSGRQWVGLRDLEPLWSQRRRKRRFPTAEPSPYVAPRVRGDAEAVHGTKPGGAWPGCNSFRFNKYWSSFAAGYNTGLWSCGGLAEPQQGARCVRRSEIPEGKFCVRQK